MAPGENYANETLDEIKGSPGYYFRPIRATR